MTSNQGFDGYRGQLNGNCVTIAEVLGTAGYRTYMCGKWHVSGRSAPMATNRFGRSSEVSKNSMAPLPAEEASTINIAMPAEPVHHTRKRSRISAGPVLLYGRDHRQCRPLSPAPCARECGEAVLLLCSVHRRPLANARAGERYRQVPGQV